MAILVILGVIVVLTALIVPLAINRRRRGSELEPPPRPSPPALRPSDAGDTVPLEVPPALEIEIESAFAVPEPAAEAEAEAVSLAPPVRPRFRDRLGKARALFSGFLARTTIDQETWDDLEEALIRADVGVGLTTSVLDDLRARVKSEGIKTPAELVDALKADLKQALVSEDRGLRFDPGEVNVWLFVGVNGVGKTTTIGKVGYREAAAGRRVVMAAGDTFRAAAAEQLELW
jgi:fused signal recognition particle receptor